jgi:Flp pilus assembly protein protease CpaA
MVVTCVILIWIALRDLRDHTITNVSLVLLCCSLFITFNGAINLIYGALTFILLISISMLVDLGGGDIKLITTLVLFAETNHSLVELISISTALVSIQILVIWIKNRKISTRIALAPSICIPMIYSVLLH